MPKEKKGMFGRNSGTGYMQGVIVCISNSGVPFTFCYSLCLCSLHISSYFYNSAHCQKGLSSQKPTCIYLTQSQSPSFDKEKEQAFGSVSMADFKVISSRKKQRDLSPIWLENITSLTFMFAMPVQHLEVQTSLRLKLFL